MHTSNVKGGPATTISAVDVYFLINEIADYINRARRGRPMYWRSSVLNNWSGNGGKSVWVRICLVHGFHKLGVLRYQRPYQAELFWAVASITSEAGADLRLGVYILFNAALCIEFAAMVDLYAFYSSYSERRAA